MAANPWYKRCLTDGGRMLLIAFLVSVVVSGLRQTGAKAAAVVSTDWFVGAHYGIGVHWTSQSVPSTGGSPVPYCTAVNNFDVNKLASQLSDAGAGYVIFTISHAQMYFAFPSPTLDAVIAGRTCTRDLYSDMYNALAPKNIKMMFYYPSVGVNDDPAWQAASKWSTDPAYFAQLQYNLVQEIGNRYGSKLAGWWVDNCFDGGYGTKYNYTTYANALRAGNPNRIVTFNFSSIGSWSSSTGQGIEDYQAGESQDLNRTPGSRYSGEGGTQWHTWVPIDDTSWVHASPGTPTPRFSDASLITYTRSVVANQGVVTYNVAPYQDTLISDQTMRQLRALKAAMRGIKVDDTDASITYAGNWSTAARNEYSGGSAHYTTSAGSYAQYLFTGTGITWYGVAGHDHGKADVYIDGNFDQTVDCYTPGWITEALYTKTGLAPGSHTIKIVERNDQNAAADGAYIELDALEATDTLTMSDDSRATYASGWDTTAKAAYYNGSAHYTLSAGSAAQYAFTGSGIAWHGVVGPDHGKADVYIDGTYDQTVDCYAPVWQATQVYSKTGLPAGSHTLKIVPRSDTSGSNSYVEVDALAYWA